ncbi:MAG TPA: 5-(carboxyamino)imidazole ribonucleotide synthase [Methylophilaceae bacterium]|jgi:5-(carboxyamino)imidazole ribonucleotide synthase
MILPSAMLGMLGGGQLGRFFVIAAHEMGYKVTVLDPDKNSPAGKIADVHLCAGFDDKDALEKMAATCIAATTEFENVPAAALEYLAQHCIVRPSAKAVAVAQNRVLEKNFLRDSGLPVAPYAVINTAKDLPTDGSELYPGILKVARFGYDGKGQARISSRAEAEAAFAKFGNETCVLERMMPLDYEISVILARDAEGNMTSFPTAENSHLHGILDISIVPARIPEDMHGKAHQLAMQVAERLEYVGVLAVEFFVSDGNLLVNEMAPRPHNSGHYTIDACVTNQFEQQVRALTGLPLGDPRMHSYAVMVNILGDIWKDKEPPWDKVLEHAQLKLHLYGKHEPRPGRKMGHFTLLGRDVETVAAQALLARRELGIGDN